MEEQKEFDWSKLLNFIDDKQAVSSLMTGRIKLRGEDSGEYEGRLDYWKLAREIFEQIEPMNEPTSFAHNMLDRITWNGKSEESNFMKSRREHPYGQFAKGYFSAMDELDDFMTENNAIPHR